MYVNGLREVTGRAIAAGGLMPHSTGRAPDIGAAGDLETLDTSRCPKCGCDDESMLEKTPEATCFCNICAHEWGKQGDVSVKPAGVRPSPEPETTATPRYASLEQLIANTRMRRDELATLAEIGALNALGYDRRSAQWQIERAVRPAGELFADGEGAPSELAVASDVSTGTLDGGLLRHESHDRPASACAAPAGTCASRRAYARSTCREAVMDAASVSPAP